MTSPLRPYEEWWPLESCECLMCIVMRFQDPEQINIIKTGAWPLGEVDNMFVSCVITYTTFPECSSLHSNAILCSMRFRYSSQDLYYEVNWDLPVFPGSHLLERRCVCSRGTSWFLWGWFRLGHALTSRPPVGRSITVKKLLCWVQVGVDTEVAEEGRRHGGCSRGA